MTLRYKIYIAAAGVILSGLLVYSAISHFEISHQEAEIERTRQSAISIQRSAEEKEMEASEYKQKIEYLEQQLVEIETDRRKQDEKLERLNVNSDRARDGVRRSRGVRANGDATADELCRSLAEVGHECQ